MQIISIIRPEDRRAKMRSAAGSYANLGGQTSWLTQLVVESCKSMCMHLHQQQQQPQSNETQADQLNNKSVRQQAQPITFRANQYHQKRNFDSSREFWNLFNCSNSQLMMSSINEEPAAAAVATTDEQSEHNNNTNNKEEDARQYDLVIFAASGTVGRFLVEEMALVIDKHYSSSSSSQQHQQQQQQQQQTSVVTSTLNLKELRDPLQFSQQSGGGARRVSVPRYVDGINWAIAGRSAVRLSDTLCKAEISTGIRDLSLRVPVILADLDHHRSLLEMCAKTSLVINCAGPYTCDGEALIRACLETRTNYLDLSHETKFIERIRLNYHSMATRNNVYIMNGCGFQSMSAEMGLNFIKQVADGQINEVKILLNLNDTKALVRPSRQIGRRKSGDRRPTGIVTSGMWNSLLLERSQSKFKSTTTKTMRTNGRSSEETSGEYKSRQRYLLRKDTQTLVRDLVEFKNKKASGWLQLIKGFNEGGRRYCLPVNTYTSDESQLTRGEMTNYELREPDSKGEGWRPIICTSYLSLRSIYEVLALFFWMLFFELLVQFPIFRTLMRAAPSISTLGQVTSSSSNKFIDRDSLNHIKFCQTFIAYGTPGDDSGDPLEKREKHLKRKQEQLLVARVVGPEPNHVATATFAVQAALALILERDHLPAGGGVLTPGVAFSETNIIYQLRRRNIKFEVLKKA